MKKVGLLAFLSMFSMAVNAAYIEVGDSGELTSDAQSVGDVTSISGNLNAAGDVDLYSFLWEGGVLTIDTFTGFGDFDTQLHLFDDSGFGIGENDDALNAGLMSEISLNLFAGSYFIAISDFNQDALDADGLSIFGFSNTFDDLNGNLIQGLEGNGALAGWDAPASGTGAYTITFSSALSAQIPEPSVLGLFALGLLVLVRAKRRQM